MNAAKQKRHTLRFERNAVCALCAIIFLAFAGAAAAGWLAAPFPVGAVLTGVAAFVLLFTGILSVSWIKFTARFYALARSAEVPCAALSENLAVTFYALPPEKAEAYLRELNAVPPLGERYTREEWLERSRRLNEIHKSLPKGAAHSFAAVCPKDLAAISGKSVFLSRTAYHTHRAAFDYTALNVKNKFVFYGEENSI